MDLRQTPVPRQVRGAPRGTEVRALPPLRSAAGGAPVRLTARPLRSVPAPSHVTSGSGHCTHHHHLLLLVDLIGFFKKETRFENTQMPSEGHKLGADLDLQREEAGLPRARAPTSPRPEPRAARLCPQLLPTPATAPASPSATSQRWLARPPPPSTQTRQAARSWGVCESALLGHAGRGGSEGRRRRGAY